MSVRLTIEINGPLDAEDRDLLSGVAVMTLAIANHEMAKNAFPEVFEDEPIEPDLPKKRRKAASEATPTPCAFLDPDGGTRICIGHAGHGGRHRFRTIGAVDADAAVTRAN